MKLPTLPRMRVDRRWSALALALTAGGLAAWLSQRHLQSRMDEIDNQARAGRTTVVVAAIDLAAGTRLDAERLALREVPTQGLPSGPVLPDEAGAVDGSVLVHPLRRGEPLQWLHLEPERATALADRLADGRRAITIPVDEISSVSGLLRPGDRVDLYVSFDHRGKRMTMPLLQGMKVLATGRQVDGGAAGDAEPARGGFSTLTLDAAPDEALRLIAARDGGTITAMLRRQGDPTTLPGAAAGGLAAMLGLDAPPPAAAPAPPRVSIIYGDRPARIPRLGEGPADEDGEATPEAAGHAPPSGRGLGAAPGIPRAASMPEGAAR